MKSVLFLGFPGELPKFEYSGRLGEVAARTLDQRDDIENDEDQRDRSTSLSAAAESLTSALHSADDSSMLDTDMDEISMT